MRTAARLRVTAVAVSAVAMSTVVGLAAPAHADIENVDDPRGDTTAFGGARHAYSLTSSADIVRSTGEYVRGRMSVTVRVADLDVRNAQTSAELVTDEGDRYYATVYRFDGRTRTELSDSDFNPVPCDGKQGSVDNGADRMTLSIPGRCLGFPTWIRWGARTFAYDETRTVGDDARRRGNGDGAIRVGERRLRNN